MGMAMVYLIRLVLDLVLVVARACYCCNIEAVLDEDEGNSGRSVATAWVITTV